jgi:hypothetical protein
MRPGVEIALLLALAVYVWLWVLMPTLRLVFADL